MNEVGCFVSSHGFGHATRMSAVLEAMARRLPLRPRIFATAGESLFRQTLDDFYYHHQLTDPGFVQPDPFAIDLKATCTRLGRLLPYDEAEVDRLARLCRNCSAIICDISAMGIAVAGRLGVPAILIENFTWDHIYAPYFERSPELAAFSRLFRDYHDRADIHIQTAPLCRKAPADLRCGPIARSLRTGRPEILDTLPIHGRRTVLISLGGHSFEPDFLDLLETLADFFFIVTGQNHNRRGGSNVQFFTAAAPLYHPDLINGVDIAVIKCGYSTLAECYQAGTPAICVGRRGFAESAALENFARAELNAAVIPEDRFRCGEWLSTLASFTPARRCRPSRNGADEVADFLLGHGLF